VRSVIDSLSRFQAFDLGKIEAPVGCHLLRALLIEWNSGTNQKLSIWS